ncbi:Acid phosphatase [Plasmodiophora brassicae]|uniref:Acid phosphatase n=1 Tax=Plasmodiophora brassicae TaxID=37360 RepID=A0A0G4J1X5_PLABS|nr:hypothetical protein PBRA_002138 [Plasmodiophora brassicae]SPQ93190.1 unnamed protein product [Plasmodiophora brassicae]
MSPTFIVTAVLAIAAANRVGAVELVTKPELLNRPTCGVDPDNAGAVKDLAIPTLDSRKYEVVQVHAFLRHGDRFFAEGTQCWPGQQNTVYECDRVTSLSQPTSSGKFCKSQAVRFRERSLVHPFNGTCEVAQLTLKGLRQMQVLGGIFKDAYGDRLLGNQCLKDDKVQFEVTDSERTILSGQAFLETIFKDAEQGPSSAIDMWTVPAAPTTVPFSNPYACPSAGPLASQAGRSTAFLSHYMGTTLPLLKELAAIAGMPLSSVNLHWFDCLAVSSCRGDPMPVGITEEIMDATSVEGLFEVNYLNGFPDRVTAGQATVGPLLRNINDRMTLGVQGEGKSFYVFSGHDTTPMMMLLSALGNTPTLWPPYGSYMSIELIQSKKDRSAYFVRFVYNGKVLRFPEPCPLDNDLCPLSAFQEMLQPMIPSRDACPDVNYEN